ncbi:MAG: hypothetical protein ACM30E_09305 [Nitrososphaerales archaeon]
MFLAATLLALLLLIAVTFVIFRPQQMVVPPQNKAIIFRNGQFHRIAGPGPVWLLAHSDTDEGWYDTCNRPWNVWVQNVLIHGIPANLHINLWIRVDLEAAAEGDRSRLAEMALLKESTRDTQVTVEVKRALDEGLATLAAAGRLPANATPLAKLEIVLPGMPLCAELLAHVTQKLPAALRAFGVILDTTKPISLVRTELPEDVVQVLQRGLLLDSLSEQLPDLPPGMRAQLAASIEGLQPLQSQELVVKSQGEAPVVARQTVPLKDGSFVDLTLGPATPPNDAPPSYPPAASPDLTGHRQQLSKQDLQVLKRVPRDPRVYRKAV